MNRTTKIKITELNPHVICVLCGGYFINATTIVECLHSFCRTCITRYLETSKYCPVCDVMVHKTRPLEYIRSDKTLQDLVYKLVPSLYKSEMKRRREYYAAHDPPGTTISASEDRGDEFFDRIIYTEDEKISLTLELCADGLPFKTPVHIHNHVGPENIKIKDVRYLHCPAAFSVGNLKKFIRMKFDLKLKYEIDIFHTAEPLTDYYTLMDIAYTYTWTRRTPLRLYYTVFERKVRPNIPDPISRHQHTPVKLTNTPKVEKIIKNDNKTPKKKAKETKFLPKSNTEVLKHENDATKVTKPIPGKRKLPDGPGDITPDFEMEENDSRLKTAGETQAHRKETGVPRKRAKKQAVVDSSVLEAMSESEEQLAKLTLDSSFDCAPKLTIDTDMVQAPHQNGSETVETVKNASTDASQSNDFKKNDNNISQTNTNLLGVDNTDTTSQISPVSISLFQPLNVTEPSEVDDTSSSENVYAFATDQTVASTNKAKVKPNTGRKRKNANDGSDLRESEKEKNGAKVENHLVMSSKHPGLKSPVRSKKETKPKPSSVKDSVKNTLTKVKNTPNKKTTVTEIDKDGNKVEKVKRKYERKKPKVDANVNKAPKKQTTSKAVTKVTNKEYHVSSSPIKATDDETKQSCSDKVQIGNSLSEVSLHIDTSKNDINDLTTDNQNKIEVAKVDTNSVASSSNVKLSKPSTVQQLPATPLYGQTPKVSDINPGQAVSPNPECADNGSLHASVHVNNVNAVSVINNTNGANSNGYITGVPASIRGNDTSAFIMPSNGASVGINVGVHPNSLQQNMFSTCATNGVNNANAANVNTTNNINTAVNGYNRASAGVGLSCYNNALSSSGNGGCIIGFPRSVITQNSLMSPGYPLQNLVSDQMSDQPLDLTNNGHRDEYTKGKIFKTKMLKKAYSKPSEPAQSPQKDKPTSQ